LAKSYKGLEMAGIGFSEVAAIGRKLTLIDVCLTRVDSKRLPIANQSNALSHCSAQL
jgi:hypothetical protein